MIEDETRTLYNPIKQVKEKKVNIIPRIAIRIKSKRTPYVPQIFVDPEDILQNGQGNPILHDIQGENVIKEIDFLNDAMPRTSKSKDNIVNNDLSVDMIVSDKTNAYNKDTDIFEKVMAYEKATITLNNQVKEFQEYMNKKKF